MVLSRGLVISLGVSALGCTLLFLYFRNKITAVENKVDIMFDLIQNHQQQQMNMQQNMHMTSHQEDVENDNTMQNQDTGAWSDEVKSEQDLIQVSEDEDDEDDDSDEVSDSDDEDEDDEEEEQPKLSLAETEDMTLEVSDVKKIVVQEAMKVANTQLDEPEDVTDSLDEIDVDEDEDDEEEDNEQEEGGDEEVVVEKLDDEFDYNKLKVSELKSLAAAKKLEGYKSLKKGPLIELLKSSE